MVKIKIRDLKEITGVGFGTSGIRSLVEKLTDKTIYTYTLGFLKFLENEGDTKHQKIAVAGDYRPSTPRIMEAVARAIVDSNMEVVNCGFVPTPAVTNFGIRNKIPSIMVTGSHIPADRNGVKFNRSEREILKRDEQAIMEIEAEIDETLFDGEGNFVVKAENLGEVDGRAREIYKNRYLDFFAVGSLEGMKIGLYGHSSVGREITYEVLGELGATVTKLEFVDEFVPIDTENISEKLMEKGREFGKDNYDALVSMDGDADRPLLGDENGDWLRSDIIPIVCAKELGIEAVATITSSNTAVEKTGWFKKVLWTRVGSPYVVEGMDMLSKEGYGKVAGYEGNGGFLIYQDIEINGKVLQQLQTRDAMIVLLSWLTKAKAESKTISQIKAQLPARYTYSSSVVGYPTEMGIHKVEELAKLTMDGMQKLLPPEWGKVKAIETLDGVRVVFENEDVVHFRPSKNAPEFRYYTESDSEEKAIQLGQEARKLVEEWELISQKSKTKV